MAPGGETTGTAGFFNIFSSRLDIAAATWDNPKGF
jgi:hypothetical protein